MQEHAWRRINIGLLIAIILINGYIIAIPLLPSVLYWWNNRDNTAQQAYTERLHFSEAPDSNNSDDEANSSDTTPISFRSGPTADGLVIPKMLLDAPLIEGPMSDSFNLLKAGAWRLPIASTPDAGSNTVIAGHRFSYTGPRGIFYYLDKLKPGDEIGMWYHGTLYLYTVESSRTVKATEVSVQQPTADTRLTLYTCTPLWNPVDRLVVVAKPKESA